MRETFTKEYRDPTRSRAAVSHHRWLRDMGAPVPALLAASPDELVFGHVGGEHCRVADLPVVAELLGRLHAVAFERQLHEARLDGSFRPPGAPWLDSFVRPRLEWLDRRRREGSISTGQHDTAVAAIAEASDRPAAVYKDCNVRNVLVDGTDITLVDFDDLTLAPFGYDLAKLLVSAAMTYGPLTHSLYTRVLDSYRRSGESAGGPESTCSWSDLGDWMEIHGLFTARYVGRNGYRYPWPEVRP
ncbi:phosphotransferase [Nocardiopsis sp. FIRDI 009]|uniref:phosphotransferase n=1 Tax=Nocardiopsis sp. FIRDI 009 TaxID=714197 RepID=UPI000E23311D